MAIHALGLGEGDDPGHTMGCRVGTGVGMLRRLSVFPRRWYWETGLVWPPHVDPARVLTHLHPYN